MTHGMTFGAHLIDWFGLLIVVLYIRIAQRLLTRSPLRARRSLRQEERMPADLTRSREQEESNG